MGMSAGECALNSALLIRSRKPGTTLSLIDYQENVLLLVRPEGPAVVSG
jgi:hypothetical protein